MVVGIGASFGILASRERLDARARLSTVAQQSLAHARSLAGVVSHGGGVANGVLPPRDALARVGRPRCTVLRHRRQPGATGAVAGESQRRHCPGLWARLVAGPRSVAPPGIARSGVPGTPLSAGGGARQRRCRGGRRLPRGLRAVFGSRPNATRHLRPGTIGSHRRPLVSRLQGWRLRRTRLRWLH